MKQKKPLRIIIIDDNPAIHKDFIKILMKNDGNAADEKMTQLEHDLFNENIEKDNTLLLPLFEIDTATQGKEGIEKIAKAIKEDMPYALAFVDIRMPPGWDGIETIKKIWALDNTIQVVICTAYSDYSWEETISHLGQRDNLLVLKKPFDNVAVRQLACALTKKWELSQDVKKYTLSLEERVKERTDSLNKSLSLMRATLESSADGVLVVDNQDKVNDYNTKLTDMWNIPASLIKSKEFNPLLSFFLNHINNADDFMSQINKLKKCMNDILIGNINLKDNRIFEYYTQPYTLNDLTIGRVWSFRDITKKAYLEQELQYQATHDLLTGLPNRIFLLNYLKQSMVNADKHHTMFGVLFLDLDRFKLINDSLSHEAGDEILKLVADRLQSAIRKQDILVRLGGDEFVIIVNDIHVVTEIKKIATKILKLFVNSFKILHHEVMLTTSIGICIYPENGNTIEILLRNADTAMYRSKELGANQFQFYTDELNEKNLDRLKNESELRHAITNNEFYLCYQPQFELTTKKLLSVEALIRWKHPTKGTMLPLDFIPLAEDTGLIVPIGEWVIKTACQQIKTWHDRGLPLIRVAVNVTTKQLRLYNLAQTIGQILKETKLDPNYLEIELSENIIVNNYDIIKTVHDLKGMGVKIVLDDFGTGYSSLNYLREIPIDRLKIDQSFVQNIESNRGDDVIIQAIISLAKNLNLEIVAEGVETQKQLEFLKSYKCGEVQGFYFSKPLSVKECENLLRKSKKLKITETT